MSEMGYPKKNRKILLNKLEIARQILFEEYHAYCIILRMR
tara:strand:+ start:226 stop:345 length:120 start_codon:yes stop_codon:yes gene_type:complete